MDAFRNLSLENLPREEWRDVVGYEGLYQVSNLGRVKSLERESNTCYSRNGKSLAVIYDLTPFRSVITKSNGS